LGREGGNISDGQIKGGLRDSRGERWGLMTQNWRNRKTETSRVIIADWQKVGETRQEEVQDGEVGEKKDNSFTYEKR